MTSNGDIIINLTTFKMTEAELILVDLAILKISINTEFSCQGILTNILVGKQDDYPPDVISAMNNILISHSSVVRDFLLKEKYITSTNSSIQRDILTEKGEIAQRVGGHEGYQKWKSEKNVKDEEKKREETKIKWPQRNWLPLLLFTAIVAPLIVELFQSIIRQPNRNKLFRSPTIQFTSIGQKAYQIKSHYMIRLLSKNIFNLIFLMTYCYT
jgi:hypothetical protein